MFKFGQFFNKSGEILPDDTPMNLELQLNPPLSLEERVSRLLHSRQLADLANSQGLESFEESEDFDVDDDFDPQTPWEQDFELASVRSVQAGVTITPETVERKEATERSKAFWKRKRAEKATPPPESPSLSPQGLASPAGASDSPPNNKE